jgi:hypothetical protein
MIKGSFKKQKKHKQSYTTVITLPLIPNHTCLMLVNFNIRPLARAYVYAVLNQMLAELFCQINPEHTNHEHKYISSQSSDKALPSLSLVILPKPTTLLLIII